MADKKIDDATPDTDVTGVEKLPVSDNGTAKCMTVAQVKDFVLAQIAALQAAGSVDVSADGVYLLKGGALKPVNADALAAAVLDYGFGKVAVAAMNGNEIVGVKDAATQKTITVSQLKAWLQANMTVTTDIDIGAKAAAGVLSGSDLFVVAQSGTNKKLTVALFTAYANAAFKDYVTALTAVDNLSNSDVFYVINGTTAKKCTVAQLKTIIGAGDVIAPDTQTSGNIPAWDSTSKRLTNGYGVASNISATPSATKLATEAAVSDAVGAKVDKVTGKGLSTNDYTDAEKAKVASIGSLTIMPWSGDTTYAVGDYCLHGGYLYRCKSAGREIPFNPAHWEAFPSYPTDASAATKFLNGVGGWSVPAGGGGGGGVIQDYVEVNVSTDGGVTEVVADVNKITHIWLDGTVSSFSLGFSAENAAEGKACICHLIFTNEVATHPTVTGDITYASLPAKDGDVNVTSFGDLIPQTIVTLIDVFVRFEVDEGTLVAVPYLVTTVAHSGVLPQ